ncbi:ketosteroid isomerase-related protein [Microbaculum sp. FT89]|uniref:ketosteroid isomerase-related protein n=1 Tax=Microbaculum sp. FT89 TaxID=3447298 RepID=UPI003F5313BF
MTDAQTKTVDLVARYYRAFNTGNVDGMLDCLGDHVVHDVNQGQRRVGREAFREFLAHINRCYSEQAVDLLVMATDDGARAAAEFTVLGAYQVTDEGLPEARGQTYRLPAGAFFEIENNRIVRVTAYYNLKDWIAQVEA